MKRRRMKLTSSAKNLKQNSTFRARDFRFPVERTESGTLYARLPSGQLVKLPDSNKE